MPGLLLVALIACVPSEINQAEARDLAIEIGKAEEYGGVTVDAEATRPLQPGVWAFRVYATNGGPSVSNLVGWVDVNKTTAEVSDPVSHSAHTISEAVARKQRELQSTHCLK
jgi:hypothetical protein